MAFDSALNEIEFVCDANGALAIAHHLPFTLHGLEATVKFFLFARFNVQQFGQPFK